MTDLERRALMGDKQAQNECTAQYIALPCPFCGKEMKKCILDRTYWEGATISEVVYEHPKCDCLLSEDWVNAGDITIWNRRAAPPVGRCGTCKKAMTKDCLLYGFDENGYCTGGPGSDYYCADYESEA